jgi:hypothetical protein
MKSKIALLARSRRLAAQARPCPPQRPSRPRQPPKPRRWRPTRMAVDYPPLPDRMEVDQESWGVPSPVLPSIMDWEPSTPVQQGSSSSPAEEDVFKRPLPPPTSRLKRRSAPSQLACTPPLSPVARPQSDSAIVPTTSERQMAHVGHVSAASPEAAYSSSPCASLVPAPAPEPAAQGDTSPPPRSRSAIMSPDEHEAHEDREAIEARVSSNFNLLTCIISIITVNQIFLSLTSPRWTSSCSQRWTTWWMSLRLLPSTLRIW